MISVINAEAGWSILEALDQGNIESKPAPKPRPVVEQKHIDKRIVAKRNLILQYLAKQRTRYVTRQAIQDTIGTPKSISNTRSILRKMEAEGLIEQGRQRMNGPGNRARTYRITKKGLEEVKE